MRLISRYAQVAGNTSCRGRLAERFGAGTLVQEYVLRLFANLRDQNVLADEIEGKRRVSRVAQRIENGRHLVGGGIGHSEERIVRIKDEGIHSGRAVGGDAAQFERSCIRS
jgi:hypothetical protein